MLSRKQAACEDARTELDRLWCGLHAIESTLNGHGVKNKTTELAFTNVHGALRLLAEHLKDVATSCETSTQS